MSDNNPQPELTQELIARLSDIRTSGGNEADTRFKIIDEILTSILGWEKTDFHHEERLSEDGQESYLDYLITTAQTSLLIEAKRAQVNFGNVPALRRAPLRGSWAKNGDLRKAILQARDYGRIKGVGFCAVTNGDAWVVFPVNRRDLVSFEDTHAVVFRSADSALHADFEEFRALLSRESVIDGSLEQQLLGGDSNQIENRRLNRIYDKSFSKITRQTMFSSIEDEIVTAFSEELIAANPELLEKAYVETADRVRFDDRIKMSVVRRDQVLRSRPLRPVGRDGAKGVGAKFTSVKVKAQPLALLTLGLVGAGKTTFLRYVETISGKAFFDQSKTPPAAHWLYVDFRNFSKTLSPRTHIFEAILNYIKAHPALGDYETTIAPAYKEEVANLTRGPLGGLKANKAALDEQIGKILLKEYEEGAPYCKRILSYASKSQACFLVIDNVDQVEEITIQDSIFLDAVAIAREANLSLVIAMRDATYVKNRSSAVFDAFTFDAIYIDPPDIQSVLSKRFTIANHLLKDKTFDVVSDGGAKVTVSDASRVVEMLSASVLGTEVGQLIEVSATGDVRLALRMTKQFLQFGYSTSYRAYRAFLKTGRYDFPVHEAVRAIMFGNQSIYRDEFSPILNPFDAKTGRSESQFLRVYVMSALIAAATTKEFQGIEASEIMSSLERMGFSSRITNKVIADLIRARVCFSRSHQEYSSESVLVPTRLCGYIVRELLGRLVFLETVIFDTFIYGDQAWEEIKDGMKSVYAEQNTVRRFKIRKSVAKQFFDWIEHEVQKLCIEASRRNLGPFWTTNPVARMRPAFEAELERAFRSAVKNYGSAKDQDEVKLPLFQHQIGN